ncbi:uncharacterized protein [Anabrus simplex]|uniref:uncharacterized protein n=1 Tax=Anabrus simplex TaxID=316456 RepID=UPI0035A2B2DC
MEEPVFVKCEPAWSSHIEEEASNFENSHLLTEVIPLKQETKSELTEPGLTQHSAGVEKEMFIEQRQPVPNIKEENNVESIAVLSVHSGEKSYICKEGNSTSNQRSNLHTELVKHTLCLMPITFRIPATIPKNVDMNTSNSAPFSSKICHVGSSEKNLATNIPARLITSAHYCVAHYFLMTLNYAVHLNVIHSLDSC